MTRIEAIRQQISELTDREKMLLAADLLENLPVVPADENESLAEARRRDEELETNPALAITWEQMRSGIGR